MPNEVLYEKPLPKAVYQLRIKNEPRVITLKNNGVRGIVLNHEIIDIIASENIKSEYSYLLGRIVSSFVELNVNNNNFKALAQQLGTSPDELYNTLTAETTFVTDAVFVDKIVRAVCISKNQAEKDAFGQYITNLDGTRRSKFQYRVSYYLT